MKFVGSLVPDEGGVLPRDEGGEIRILAGIKRLVEGSPAPFSVVQLSVFSGTRQPSGKLFVPPYHRHVWWSIMQIVPPF